MGRWKLRTEGCVIPLARDIESGTWIGHSEVADYFVHYHNADCDAYEKSIAELTADRDEWKRRLDAVVVQFGEIVCDPSCGITWTCSRCQAHAAAIAIAEGLDNG